MAGLDPAIQPQDPKRRNLLSWIVTRRNAVARDSAEGPTPPTSASSRPSEARAGIAPNSGQCVLRPRRRSVSGGDQRRNLCRRRQSGLGARFTPLWSDFGPFSPVSLMRCMQKAGSLCGRGAIQDDCGKQPIAEPVCVNRGMVNCIYFRSDFAPERAIFGLQVRKSAAG